MNLATSPNWPEIDVHKKLTEKTVKIITLEQFELAKTRRGYNDLLLRKAIHNSVHRIEIEDQTVHYNWPYCPCTIAKEIRNMETTETRTGHIESDVTALATAAVTVVNANNTVDTLDKAETLTFEQWKDAYNKPETIRDAYNALFCGDCKPVIEMTAEELNEKRFFLEQLMSSIKIHYKKVLDLEQSKMDALDDVERVKIRKIDAARRAEPSKENYTRQMKMTTQEKTTAALAKTLGVSGSVAAKKMAELIDDLE